MRGLLWLLLGLAACGWLAAICPSEVLPHNQALDWRRTVNGWERAGTWLNPNDSPADAVHPAWVAAVVGLFSLAAVLGLPSQQGIATAAAGPQRTSESNSATGCG